MQGIRFVAQTFDIWKS